MIRVRWTQEEQELLIAQAAKLLYDRQAFSLKEAFDKAQEVLPIARRRQIAALTQVKWFTDETPKKVKAFEDERRSGNEAKIAQAVAEATARAYFSLQEEWIRKAGLILAKIIVVALEDPEVRDAVRKVMDSET